MVIDEQVKVSLGAFYFLILMQWMMNVAAEKTDYGRHIQEPIPIPQARSLFSAQQHLVSPWVCSTAC